MLDKPEQGGEQESSSNEDNPKNAFLKREFLTLSLNGALQVRRSKVYQPKTNDANKERLRCSLRERLDALAKDYENVGVSSDKHLENILELANYISNDSQLKGVLAKRRFRIGIAQKALNLYLKYLWCAGLLPNPPPHCPFDSLILSYIGRKNERWTKIDSKEEYLSWIDSAKQKAKEDNYAESQLAEWELKTWNSVRSRSQFMQNR